MKAFALTDVGMKRTSNQDYVFYSIDAVGHLPNLFIVADGMGGHKAGDIASRFTVETFLESVRESNADNPITIIEEAITKANLSLMQKAQSSEEMEGMGTTLVVATIYGNSMYVANVGDSRLYIINNNIQQITRDHSFVEEMVSIGELDKESARYHEKKNIITRAVGATENLVADFFEVELADNDRILMCSDGLSNMLNDSELKSLVNKGTDITDTVHKLIEAANNSGGKDNIAVVLINNTEAAN